MTAGTVGRGLVALGETLVLLSQPGIGRLRHATSLTVGIGGAESNVAIGAARLGTSATWVSRVGADELGDLVVSRVRAEGVRVLVAYDQGAPTALMFKERRNAAHTAVTYYRAGGPGSRLTPADLPPDLFLGAGVLHVSGITSALGDSAHETVRVAIQRAREARVTVSLDVNYRRALWSPERAGAVLGELLGSVDVLFASDDEAVLLGHSGEPAAQAAELAGRLADPASAQVVIKLGAQGAQGWIAGETLTVAPVPVTAVDPVGAGDAFVAGYLAELLAQEPASVRLSTAAICGAFAVTSPGDWEALPTRADLQMLGGDPGTVQR